MVASAKVPGLLKAAVEMSANRLLALNETSDEQLEGFEGKVVSVRVKGLEFDFVLLVLAGGISIFDSYPGEADVSISGTPSALIKLIAQDDIMMLMQSGEIEMRGDVSLGRKLKQVFLLSSIDWEELVAQAVGDMPAYQLSKTLRQVSRTVKRLGDSVKSNMSEYLQEEARSLPTAIEVENFIRDVDDLRNDAEVLVRRSQKIARLHLKNTNESDD